MKKPVITIRKSGETYIYNCNFANYIHKCKVWDIKVIFYILNIYYLCEKDEKGQYMQRDNIKPIFDL